MIWKNGLIQAAYLWKKFWEGLTLKRIGLIMVGAAITSFGLYNIHQQTSITEGGVMGMMLLINHWLGISPSLITPVLDLACYGLAFRYLGGQFIKISILSTMGVSGFFSLWERRPPVLPDLSANPLLAAVLGGCFIGIGVGLIVRQGGSSGGDDALALVIQRISGWRLSRAYLFSDLTVLVLSLSYIPVRKIVFSLITVTISSCLIDFVQKADFSQGVGGMFLRRGKRCADCADAG